jgi:hypothetical protein
MVAGRVILRNEETKDLVFVMLNPDCIGTGSFQDLI